MQLEAISSCSIANYLGEETDLHLAIPSFLAAVENDKGFLECHFLQAKQPQLLFLRLVVQSIHQLNCPFQDMLQHLNIFFL